jgi:hypothetical protein
VQQPPVVGWADTLEVLDPLADAVSEPRAPELAALLPQPRRKTTDWSLAAVGGAAPRRIDTAPRGSGFRIALLLIMLVLLGGIAIWTPARLQAVAASTIELLISTDVATTRTAAGPGPLVGQLDVTSSPSGVEFYVNGELQGVTPLQMALRVGHHEVTLVSPIGEVRRTVRIWPGQRTLFSEAIFPGSLVVRSEAEVEIEVGGRRIGAADGEPLVLAPGSYQIDIVNLGTGGRTTQRVEILPGQVTTHDADAVI